MSTQAPPTPPETNEIPPVELLKARSQLAWNWFEYHARQRMTMFNNFLIITGILINAYALGVKDGFYGMAALVALLGFLQALCFFMIDVRSRHLIRYGEDVLEKLERDTLFPDSFTSPEIAGGKTLGLLRCDQDLREGKRFIPRRLYKMKYWIRGMYVLVLLAFVLAVVDAGFRACVGWSPFPALRR